MRSKTPSNNIEQLQLDYGSFWEFSSVWLECFLDMEEVVGPNPTTPTNGFKYDGALHRLKAIGTKSLEPIVVKQGWDFLVENGQNVAPEGEDWRFESS